MTLQTPSRPSASVGRWPVVAAFVLLLFLGLLIHRDYGISTDEGMQRIVGAVTVKYLAEWLAPSLVTPSMAFLEPLATFRDRDYGVGFEAPAVALEAILRLTDKRDVYFLRHLLTFLVCLVGVWALYGLALRRLGSRSFALLAVTFLVLSPRQFAESFYNSKDLVFMAAFTLSLYSMFALVGHVSVARTFVHALASAFALDVRLAALIVPLMTIALLVVVIGRRDVSWRRGVTIAVLYLVATSVFLYALWPWLWASPLDRFAEAIVAMSRFRFEGRILYLGESIDAKSLPWHYVPVWIAVTTPPLYLLLFAVGTAGLLWRTGRRRWKMLESDADLQDVVCAAVVFVPVVATFLLRPVLYDGWRHFYFIYPCLLLLAVRGWAMIWTAEWMTPMRHAVLWLVTVVLLSWTAWWMVRAHPYQNVYFNALAGGNLRARFELDYWGLGTREALEDILRRASDQRVRVKVGGFLPLELGVGMLTPEQRQRVEIVTDDDTPHYLLHGLSWGPPEADARYRERYDLVRELKAGDLPILEIYKSR